MWNRTVPQSGGVPPALPQSATAAIFNVKSEPAGS